MKRKTKGIIPLLLALVFGIIGISFTAQVTAFAASLPGQTSDEYFIETMEKFGYFEGYEFEKSDVYNEYLEPNGVEYRFTINEDSGYALMIKWFDDKSNEIYEISEIVFDTESPFKGVIGKKVYVKQFYYLEYLDGEFFDIKEGIQLDFTIVNYLSKSGLSTYAAGSSSSSNMTETISYTNKTDYSFDFLYGLPSYYASSYGNSCSNIAGGILIGYFDIFYPNLVPNFTTNYYAGGKWRYYNQNSVITGIIDELHFMMLTNVYNGTTINNFKTGLSQYFARNSLTLSYVSTMSNGTFNYSEYKNQVHNGKPVALFVANHNLVDINMFLTLSSLDQITIAYLTTNHTMVGSGYRELAYYRNGSNIRNDTYLNVSTAFSGIMKGYMRLFDNANINDAFSVNIN